ncbi:MAG: hypothetical protein HFG30_06320 [Eubacterium sp.]|jgi:hypothetical protein|nr:hypothetical protein [Eubacterium sp.]
MKYFNIAFELVILLNVYIQIKMIKREKYIYVIVVGIIIILAEIVYVSFAATMIESVLNIVLIALQGSVIGRQLLLGNSKK